MHLKNFDLNLLVVLDALLSECNVTRAAERLCVSQPAMSNALQRIREHFNDPILVRNGREMQPTALGQTLLDPVRELILQAEGLLKGDSNFDPRGAIRTVRIAMTDYCAEIFVGPLMRLLAQEAPSIRVEVVPIGYSAADDLTDGKIDMCMTAQDLRMLVPDADTRLFGRATLFSDEFVCAIDPDNREVGEELDFETYVRLPHAVTRWSNHALSLEEQAMRRLGLDLDIRVVTQTFSSLPSLLAGTPLVITIQKRLCDRLIAAYPMRVFFPPAPIPSLQETLYWHNRSENDKAHSWMRQTVCKAAQQL